MMNKELTGYLLTNKEYEFLENTLKKFRYENRKEELKKRLEANIMTLINDIEIQTTLNTSEIYEVLNEVSCNVALNE